jgi:hypothetical protein
MIKPTPNPPDTNPASPYESLDSRKLLANPAYDTESLLANASESLGSATTMLSNFAALLDNSHRKTLLGITQVVMLGELAVNQALDKVEVKE